MYGGDEVSAIVVDLGSHTCKAGYTGEDAPKSVFPSVAGYIDQMEVDEPAAMEKNSEAGQDPKNVDKSKQTRKLYVGTQALGYRRDHMEESPQAARVKVLASGNTTEKRFSVWIGGSILASLGTFQQIRI